MQFYLNKQAQVYDYKWMMIKKEQRVGSMYAIPKYKLNLFKVTVRGQTEIVFAGLQLMFCLFR